MWTTYLPFKTKDNIQKPPTSVNSSSLNCRSESPLSVWMEHRLHNVAHHTEEKPEKSLGRNSDLLAIDITR